ncbi:menaquinone-dependent protoporphyrinogen IX dehydrogenase [Tolumonas lignilytica]|jgi:Flavodoxin|uniref:menaquinone-dependent protoporphyrinogen IX dehydrogenase n=1 Tax=Tolumonas lignilytica TaxID=1283284 RepID=UPI00046571C7|nr:menaquinone-dependent protoporphyrinogen IX dehydrogenase [Tolumonas lignilytica]
MTKRILVLYSTREGQTRKIIEAILNAAPEWQAEVYDLHTQPVVELASYDKILIAASIRYGHFHPSLNQFIKQHHMALKEKEAAFVAVNLVARKPEKNTPETNLYTRKWLQQSPWTPQHVAVFAGALRYSRYNWWQKRIIQFIMWITGGSTDTTHDIEFTNWANVQKFAEQLLKS